MEVDGSFSEIDQLLTAINSFETPEEIKGRKFYQEIEAEFVKIHEESQSQLVFCLFSLRNRF
jgi:hypothetical protein